MKIIRKIKKSGKKWLVSAMAAVLLLSGAVTVSAEANKGPEPIRVESKSKVQKVWTVANAMMFDEATNFTLELSYLGKTNLGTNEAADPAGILPGTPNRTVIGGTGKWTGQPADAKTHTAFLTYEELFGGITFSTPGIYHFTVNEKAGTDPNIAYSGQTYYVEVQVSWAVDTNGNLTGALHMDGIAVYAGPQKGIGDKVDVPMFHNKEVKNSSLTVTKTVKGNAANKNDVFEFTVKVTGVSGSYPATNTAGKVTAVNGVITEKVYLKNGEKFVIYNLPAGAAYTVTEMDTAYNESFRIDSGESKDGLEAAGKIGRDDTVAAFTNTKTITPPTGIFMDVMPYVLLLAAAVLGCVVFFVFRRRRPF